MTEQKISYGSFNKLVTNYKYDLKGKLIVLTSINPASNGEGKTTTLIGLVDLFNFYHQKAIGCLRQPSIGPFLGMKGGATGSGQCQLKNDFEINTGLTGDFDKIALVNNLIVSMIENEIYFDSNLKIDPNKIFINRCYDLNDRSLRQLHYPIKKDIATTSSFSITAASNLMAAFCLVNNLEELKKLIENAIVAFDINNNPIRIADLKIIKMIEKLLQFALFPNEVKTSHGNSILMHGGPFANIAHGCNSIIATKMGMTHYDFVFSECGFGSDLGLEKFINIKARRANIFPNLVIYAISLKSILEHGNNDLAKGFENLKAHIQISHSFGIKPIVIINHFNQDKQTDIDQLVALCQQNDIKVGISKLWANGPDHVESLKLYEFIQAKIQEQVKPKFSYDLNDDILTKIEKVAFSIYQAKKVEISQSVLTQIKNFTNGERQFEICIAKDQKTIIGNNDNDGIFKVFDIKINYMAKLIILISSKVFLMPGLPKNPNAKEVE